MMRKQAIYTCDACGAEVVVEHDVPTRPIAPETPPPSDWFTVGHLGDYAAHRMLCSPRCVLRMATALVEDGRLPMFLPDSEGGGHR